MKKQIALLTLLFVAFTSLAQNGFNYKALLTENNSTLSNQNVDLRFTILQNGTSSVYQETQSATTDANGIVSVAVGEGTAISGNFDNIDWAQNYFLKVEIDTGNGYQDFGTTELKYVPYAKYAETAGNTFSGNFPDLANIPAGLSDGDDVNDADHSPTNELQTISKTGNTVTLSNGGGSFTDADTHLTETQVDNMVANNGYAKQINDLSDARYLGNSLYLGSESGLNDDGTTNGNTGIGKFALKYNTSGSRNVAVGKGSLFHTTSGTSNVAIGNDALLNNTTGQDNIGIGLQALNNTTIGHHNVAIGTGAGFNNHTGSSNVFIGANAGYNEHGSNKLYIENSNSSTPLIGGDFSANTVDINGKLYVKNSGDSRFELIGNSKHGWISRYTNRLHIASDDAIYFGTNGATDTDLVIKHNGDIQVNHKLTSPTTGTANLLPFAYGNIDHDFNNGNDIITNGTGNLSASWDSVGVCQIRLYGSNGQEIPFDPNHFTVLITPRTTQGLYSSYHVYSNRLYVKFFHNETHHLTTDFSILIYKN